MSEKMFRLGAVSVLFRVWLATLRFETGEGEGEGEGKREGERERERGGERGRERERAGE